MTLQMRQGDDDRFYSANRDIAHCFSSLAREVANRLEDERWPVLVRYLEEKEITMDQLGDACGAFINFVGGACHDPKEKMGDVLARVGWDDVPEEAQLALCAVVGTVMLGAFFTGARDATIGGDGPLASVADLVESGRVMRKWLAAPKWRRWVWRLMRWNRATI